MVGLTVATKATNPPAPVAPTHAPTAKEIHQQRLKELSSQMEYLATIRFMAARETHKQNMRELAALMSDPATDAIDRATIDAKLKADNVEMKDIDAERKRLTAQMDAEKKIIAALAKVQ